MDTKLCTACGQEKPLSEYYVQGYSKADGHPYHTGKCKLCMSAYRHENVEKLTASRRRWMQNNRERSNAHQRDYRRRNLERMLTYERLRYRSGKGRERANARFHRLKLDPTFRAQRRQWKQTRRARLNGVENSLTTEQWLTTLSHFGGVCAYCGSPDRVCQDHFVPISRGGHTAVDNIVPACWSCNCSKHDSDPRDWCSPETYARLVSYLQRSTPRGTIP